MGGEEGVEKGDRGGGGESNTHTVMHCIVKKDVLIFFLLLLVCQSLFQKVPLKFFIHYIEHRHVTRHSNESRAYPLHKLARPVSSSHVEHHFQGPVSLFGCVYVCTLCVCVYRHIIL